MEMLVENGLDPRVLEDGQGGNIMSLYTHANTMSDERRVPVTNFKLKEKGGAGGATPETLAKAEK